MNEELLNAAKEFDAYFISKFPKIDHPVKLISDFNLSLSEFAQESADYGETIGFITLLLTNSDLEEFASKDSQSDRRVSYEQASGYDDDNPIGAEDEADKHDKEIIEQAHKVVYGDKGHDDGGLKEWVNKLINDLEANMKRS